VHAAVALPRRRDRERPGFEGHGVAEAVRRASRRVDELDLLGPGPGRSLEDVRRAGVERRAGVVVRRAHREPVAVQGHRRAEPVVAGDLEPEDLLLHGPRAGGAHVGENGTAPAAEPGVGLGSADREGVAGERKGSAETVGLNGRRKSRVERPRAPGPDVDVHPAAAPLAGRGHRQSVPVEGEPGAEARDRPGVGRGDLSRLRPRAAAALEDVDAARFACGEVVPGDSDRQRVAVGGQGRTERVCGVAERVSGRQEARLGLPRGQHRRRWGRPMAGGHRPGEGDEGNEDQGRAATGTPNADGLFVGHGAGVYTVCYDAS
jgi:hypothetical protein